MSASIKKFQDWYLNDALPLWAARGYDHGNGGFFESLDFDGNPVKDQPRRVRVQARQIHTFAQAARLNWSGDAAPIAKAGFDYFLAKACPENGLRGCVHTLGDVGDIIDDRRDLYDQAFCLLACASVWKAFSDERALDLAGRTMDFLQDELASPHGGWHESDKRELPRRQNPHMHLLEALTALYKATKDDRWRRHAETILDQCLPKFLDADREVLLEYFEDDLSPSRKHNAIEPGHMFEWVWLLDQVQDVAPRSPMLSWTQKLYNRAKNHGEDRNFHGFVNNSVNLDASMQNSSKRIWPQTEYIKAACVCAAGGDGNAANTVDHLIDGLFETYLNTGISGLWIDEFDPEGNRSARDVPASILYHLHEAVAQTMRYTKSGVST